MNMSKNPRQQSFLYVQLEQVNVRVYRPTAQLRALRPDCKKTAQMLLKGVYI